MSPPEIRNGLRRTLFLAFFGRAKVLQNVLQNLVQESPPRLPNPVVDVPSTRRRILLRLRSSRHSRLSYDKYAPTVHIFKYNLISQAYHLPLAHM